MIPKKVKQFAQIQGYKEAVFLKKRKGYKCYEPIMQEEVVSYIGLPLVIMEKGAEIRMSTPEEAMEI